MDFEFSIEELRRNGYIDTDIVPDIHRGEARWDDLDSDVTVDTAAVMRTSVWAREDPHGRHQ
jgi:hypothetical protein